MTRNGNRTDGRARVGNNETWIKVKMPMEMISGPNGKTLLRNSHTQEKSPLVPQDHLCDLKSERRAVNDQDGITSISRKCEGIGNEAF